MTAPETPSMLARTGTAGPRPTAGRRCVCGHVDVLHDIRRNKTRGACSHHDGPKCTPCGCAGFTELEVA